MTGTFSRRRFLQVLGTTALLSGASRANALAANRKMTMDLVCGNIGVRPDLPTAIELAHKHHFESVAPDAGYLAKLGDAELERLLRELKQKNLVWGSTGLPVDFRNDDDTFRTGMETLPDFARTLKRAGATRVNTWIKPAHDQLTYSKNFRQHTARLREVARVLEAQGLRFGLEYVGPKTSWTALRHPFIHTMAEMQELITEIGVGSVGLVLDSWHWYHAGESPADIRRLSNLDVVACDLNDAPPQFPIDQQRDTVRELPLATKIIDLNGFLHALLDIGYDGPVRAEPFNATLRTMPADDAVATTSRAMRRAFDLL